MNMITLFDVVSCLDDRFELLLKFGDRLFGR
jgi:hypothetical protein